jgi:hypothetical protein
LDWDGFNIDENDLPVLPGLEKTYLELNRRIQEESYAEEIKKLRRGKCGKVSPTRFTVAVTPVIEGNGFLQFFGRIVRVKLL